MFANTIFIQNHCLETLFLASFFTFEKVNFASFFAFPKANAASQ